MNSIERFGDRLIEVFHLVGLFVIGGTIVWSAIHEYISIMSKSHAGLDDILLLFIYLELGAMIGIYFKTTTYVDYLPLKSRLFEVADII